MVTRRRRSHRKAQAKLQQIACLGLTEQWVIPELLKAVHEWVPAYWRVFHWCDPSGNITNVYNDLPLAMTMAPDYVNNTLERQEREVFRGWQYVCKNSHRATDFDQFLTVSRKAFFNHDFYQHTLRPMEFFWGIMVVIRDGGTPLGILGMTRRKDEPPFTQEDAHNLDLAVPFISHAMIQARSARAETDWVDSEDEGLMLCTEQGQIQHWSDRALQLWLLSQHSRFRHGQVSSDTPRQLDRRLMRLVHTLKSIRANQPCSRPPAMTTETAWGRFRFSARWLTSQNDQQSLIAINIHRQEPWPVALHHQVESLGLAPRQTQICLLLANGFSFQQIAQQLSVSEHTAISHGRSIYDNLGVNSRSELISRLASRVYNRDNPEM